ncbi:unnamed protein product [Oikopleura dioica]|uniref:Uncharacterized protein n=1 Tax=Oikopleura dioica TaxID=34765 RepID=E4XQE7_OIKDI|nr:unnamed protein product [Oikopleura dioica]
MYRKLNTTNILPDKKTKEKLRSFGPKNFVLKTWFKVEFCGLRWQCVESKRKYICQRKLLFIGLDQLDKLYMLMIQYLTKYFFLDNNFKIKLKCFYERSTYGLSVLQCFCFCE